MRKMSFVEKFSTLIVAIVGVLGVVLGGTVSHLWTRVQMKEQQRLERADLLEVKRLELRKTAYTDFLRGQTLLWGAPEDQHKANQLITNAKLNILLTGPNSVLCAMVIYWISAENYKDCSNPDLKRQEAVIYQQMRRDFFTSMDFPDAPDLDASVVVPYIWNCSLPDGNLEKVCKNEGAVPL